jgi:antitoxin component YwqK of YwqJK toxin-antitoxin module
VIRVLCLSLIPLLLWSEEVIVETPFESVPVGLEHTLLCINQKIKYVSLEEGLQEQIHGIEEVYFDQAFIQRVKAAAEKNEEGEYVENWSNGKRKARIPYKKGFLHGHIHGWYPEGPDAFKGFYKDGLRLGIHMTFDHTDCPTSTVYYTRVLQYDKDGFLEGKQTTYHLQSDGLYALLPYKHGVLDGKLEFYENPFRYVNGLRRYKEKTQVEERIYEKGVFKKSSSYIEDLHGNRRSI